jgi:hypothetical protein
LIPQKNWARAHFRRSTGLITLGYPVIYNPQYQIASEKGAKGYSGGNFEPNSDNRFLIRRGRLRFDYMRTDELHRNQIQFVFQFDGTERGVFIRDFWGRYWENKWQLLAFTGGMFARPFWF